MKLVEMGTLGENKFMSRELTFTCMFSNLLLQTS
jgi:hypothetical protein